MENIKEEKYKKRKVDEKEEELKKKRFKDNGREVDKSKSVGLDEEDPVSLALSVDYQPREVSVFGILNNFNATRVFFLVLENVSKLRLIQQKETICMQQIMMCVFFKLKKDTTKVIIS